MASTADATSSETAVREGERGITAHRGGGRSAQLIPPVIPSFRKSQGDGETPERSRRRAIASRAARTSGCSGSSAFAHSSGPGKLFTTLRSQKCQRRREQRRTSQCARGGDGTEADEARLPGREALHQVGGKAGQPRRTFRGRVGARLVGGAGTAHLRPQCEGRDLPVRHVRGSDGGHRDRRPAGVPGPGAGPPSRQGPRHDAVRWLVCQSPPWHAAAGRARPRRGPDHPMRTAPGVPLPSGDVWRAQPSHRSVTVGAAGPIHPR